jgi:hypothetical protein
MDSSSDTVLTTNHPATAANVKSIEGQISHGLRKPPRSVAEFEPLLTADEVAKLLNVQHGLGVGSFLSSQTALACHTHGRWHVALSAQRNRGIRG